MNTSSLIIEQWTPEHPFWQKLVQAVAQENQTHWAFEPFFEQFARYFLVALSSSKVVGFLMFVVWDIGPNDRDHPPLQFHGETLMEAKIIAFGVQKAHRRRGIG